MGYYIEFEDPPSTPFDYNPHKDEVIVSWNMPGLGEFLIVWHEEPWLLEELFLICKEEDTQKYVYKNEGLAALCGEFPSLTKKLTDFCKVKRNQN